MSSFRRSSDADVREARSRALQRSALRQAATLRAASAAVTYAPTLDECAAAIERAREELEHLEASVEAYRELCGDDLHDVIASEVASLPLPQSWEEASVAQLVLCLASQLEVSHRSLEPSLLSAALLRQLAQENEHVDAARAALHELRVRSPSSLSGASFARWLRVARQSLTDGIRESFLEALARDIAALGLGSDALNIIAA